MSPLMKKKLLISICAIVICALAATAAGIAITGRAKPAKLFMTHHMAVRSTQKMGASWISAGAKEPNSQWRRAYATLQAKSGAPRQISVPFRGLLGPTNRDTFPGDATRHVFRNWWVDGGPYIGLPLTHRVRPQHHRRLHRHESPPRTLPR